MGFTDALGEPDECPGCGKRRRFQHTDGEEGSVVWLCPSRDCGWRSNEGKPLVPPRRQCERCRDMTYPATINACPDCRGTRHRLSGIADGVARPTDRD